MTLEIQVNKSIITTEGVHGAIKAALGAVAYGVGTGPGWVKTILTAEATAEQRAVALTILNAHNQLVVLTNKTTITADGVDTATITCNDAAIGADAAIDYTVWYYTDPRRKTLYAEGSDTLASGAATLTLATEVIGTYLIEIRRQSGNYATGYVEVTAE